MVRHVRPMTKRHRAHHVLSFVALFSLLGCDSEPESMDQDMAAPAGGKTDSADDVGGDELVEEAILLTRVDENGVVIETIPLEGEFAEEFEELIDGGGVGDEEVNDFVKSLPGDHHPEADDGDGTVLRNVPGLCVPLVNRHIRTMHVGKSDQSLIERAPTLPEYQASSWPDEATAYTAISQHLALSCREIINWQAFSTIGMKHVSAVYTPGGPGRVCDWEGNCIPGLATRLVYQKTFNALTWHAGKIVTAFPVPF